MQHFPEFEKGEAPVLGMETIHVTDERVRVFWRFIRMSDTSFEMWGARMCTAVSIVCGHENNTCHRQTCAYSLTLYRQARHLHCLWAWKQCTSLTNVYICLTLARIHDTSIGRWGASFSKCRDNRMCTALSIVCGHENNAYHWRMCSYLLDAIPAYTTPRLKSEAFLGAWVYEQLRVITTWAGIFNNSSSSASLWLMKQQHKFVAKATVPMFLKINV